ncbi:hypothetical protein CLSA_c44260 [Clostridium saccharobutylicum DSM 13864]|uniref:Uncharacterized protein n=1 Tax=Clostridium saccharobutylicum DSM 13864 TaxID=1345695 RepID=U5MXS7_CLOSA|nr:hypothetical protein CLSA_c44260 [Clostridium saccharobutylicum DSM 13864]
MFPIFIGTSKGRITYNEEMLHPYFQSNTVQKRTLFSS